GTTYNQGQPGNGNGQWRPQYGSDVGTTYNPGGQQNPPGYDATVAAQQPQPQVGPEGVLPGGAANQLPTSSSGETLPGPQQPVHERGWFSTGIAGGTGAYLLGHPIPKYLNTASSLAIDTNPQWGTKFFGADSWLAKNSPDLATRVQTTLDAAP